MRLLFVSHSFPPPDRPLSNVGGMQRVATELHDALTHHPEVAVDALVLRSSWRWTHVRTGPFLLRALRYIKRRVSAGEVDVVLFSSMVTAALAPLLHKTLEAKGVPMAAIVHGRDVTLPVAPYQRLVPHVFRHLDAVLPVSRATGKQCILRGLPETKMHVVPNGVDLERFSQVPDTAPARDALRTAFPEHPLPDDVLLLCSVGRHVARKGFAWFVAHVMPLLPRDVHYWLAGDGPETEAIEQTIETYGLGQRVRLLGRITEEELALLYRSSDLFVMPNVVVPGDMEGFGVVMLEAGLFGLPTVGARLEGIQDVIAEGENGHLVESGNAWAFSEAIMAYYHNREALDAASTRASDYVARTFSWSAVADRYVQTLQTLLPTRTEQHETVVRGQ